MRRRVISPEFWTDSNIVGISRDARLLFIGLWNYADDEGFFIGDLPAIERTLFPSQGFDITCPFAECRRFLVEYSYTPQGGGTPRPAYQIRRFSNWQTINRPSQSKIKPFCSLTDDSLNTHGVLSENLGENSVNLDREFQAQVKLREVKIRAPKKRVPVDPLIAGERNGEGDSAGLRWAIGRYHDLFFEKFSVKPDFVGGRDGKILSALIKSHGADAVTALLESFFRDPPDWIQKQSKFTIPAFKSVFTELLARSRNSKTQMGAL